jgi:O-antigen/teichoic acid export membrane protein
MSKIVSERSARGGAVSAPAEPVLSARPDVGVVDEMRTLTDPATNSAEHDLKGKTARGVMISTFGQGASFFLRAVSLVVLSRVLGPADFGLVGMATVCTGFLNIFQDAGLSMATIQRVSITRGQISTLFWINVAIGVALAALCAAIAPLLAAFYHEPRLLSVTIVTGAGFLLSGATPQHRALLMRDMRFALLTMIDIGSLFVSVALGIGMAVAGFGYWSLVGMTVSQNVVTVVSLWVASGWVPGPPRRGVGVRSMLKYGGTLTLNNVIAYITYNLDKVLIGRVWGVDILGIYGRAYQLINMPTANLNAAVAQVAFPALSRLQDDPARMKSYFLKGYALFLSLVLPITMGCALFPEDIIRVFLGPKWGQAVPVFRMLAPTVLAFKLINPFGWFMQATGRAARSLHMCVLVTPVVILGYVAGLPYGARGVAAGFSVATLLLVVPVIFWSTRGTSITVVDTFRAVFRPFLSILIAAGAALAMWPFIHLLESPLLRLFAANAIMFGIYGVLLWFVMGQKAVYLGLLKNLDVWPLAGRRRQAESHAAGKQVHNAAQ